MAANDWPYWAPVPTTTVQQTFLLGGWKCPECLRCYSPAMVCCPLCPQQQPGRLRRDQ
jgi:hypothetical protein